MNTTKVISNGRVTIPAGLRKKHKIKAGTNIAFIDEGKEIRLQPINKAYIQTQIGFMNTKGKLKRALMREKKREKGL